MTVQEAVERLRSVAVGEITVHDGDVCCRIPRSKRAAIKPSLDVIRERKQEALALLEEHRKGYALETVLKGRAIALYCNLVNQTLWLVADEEDVHRLAERRGVVYSAPEIREILKVKDPQIVAEIHRWKEIHNATIRGVEKPKS